MLSFAFRQRRGISACAAADARSSVNSEAAQISNPQPLRWSKICRGLAWRASKRRQRVGVLNRWFAQDAGFRQTSTARVLLAQQSAGPLHDSWLDLRQLGKLWRNRPLGSPITMITMLPKWTSSALPSVMRGHAAALQRATFSCVRQVLRQEWR